MSAGKHKPRWLTLCHAEEWWEHKPLNSWFAFLLVHKSKFSAIVWHRSLFPFYDLGFSKIFFKIFFTRIHSGIKVEKTLNSSIHCWFLLAFPQYPEWKSVISALRIQKKTILNTHSQSQDTAKISLSLLLLGNQWQCPAWRGCSQPSLSSALVSGGFYVWSPQKRGNNCLMVTTKR